MAFGIPHILIGASSVVLLLTSLFGFGGTDEFIDVAITFGMQFLPSENQLKVWTTLPPPGYVDVKLFDFTKFDGSENGSSSELVEFFPVSDEPNVGRAKASFTIELISDAAMPELNLTQEFVPMVWRREDKTEGKLQALIMIIAAFSLNNWFFIKWGIIGGAVGGLLAGVGLFLTRPKGEPEEELE